MNLVVIGHGYVGLVTAAVFAELGNSVYCIGRDKEKIRILNQGIPTFFEPGLEEVLSRNVSATRLKFTLDYKNPLKEADIIFICVGTPPKSNGEADLSSVFTVAKKIGQNLSKYTVIACKSTVPPGINRKVGQIIKRANKSNNFDIASVPEFLREGSALADTLTPDRIILGVESQQAKNLLVDLHKPIDGKVVICSIETAEMIKYAANAILSTKISFANAIAFICEKVGADVTKVIEAIGLDKRIGLSFLNPGVGYGGSCFPKDVKALIAIAANLGYDFKLLKAVDQINQQAIDKYIEKIKAKFGNRLKDKTAAILGLAFKPNTDDMREAPSVKIIKKLQKFQVKIKAYDPAAMNNARSILDNVIYCGSAYEATKDADMLCIVTEWNEFKQLNLTKLARLMRGKYVFDGRNIYEPEKVTRAGLSYIGIGRS